MVVVAVVVGVGIGVGATVAAVVVVGVATESGVQPLRYCRSSPYGFHAEFSSEYCRTKRMQVPSLLVRREPSPDYKRTIYA